MIIKAIIIAFKQCKKLYNTCKFSEIHPIQFSVIFAVYYDNHACSVSVITTAYNAVVRPILEYASPVWCIHFAKCVELI